MTAAGDVEAVGSLIAGLDRSLGAVEAIERRLTAVTS